MKLRLRGALQRDCDWPYERPPGVTEMVKLAEGYFRVTNVVWAVKEGNPDLISYDVAVVLSAANEPAGLKKVSDDPA